MDVSIKYCLHVCFLLPLISFNKTEAAISPLRLCFLKAFPFITSILI